MSLSLTLPGPSWTCSRVGIMTRMTVPGRTPLSRASVYDASTSPGSAWLGIRPESSLTVCGRLADGISNNANESRGIGLLQVSQPAGKFTGPGTGVTAATCGMLASVGSGWAL